MELIELLGTLGFEVIDQFVLVQEHRPIMRHSYQKSARKNHSYARLRTVQGLIRTPKVSFLSAAL